MVFSSLEFIFLFLPASLILYFAVPWKLRNFALLAVSLFFYGWGEPIYVFLMIATILIDYLFGMLIGRVREKGGNRPRERMLLTAAIVINLALLGFFKYTDFFINTANSLFNTNIQALGISLPIGISFYTFQSLSYVIDVYRRDSRYQKSFVSFGAYVTLFPQLIAGPIVRYHDVDLQLDSRTVSVSLAASGARTFTAGLLKKVILGNSAAAMWNLLADSDTTLGAWLAIIFYTFHIYYDFSGYSDMAIGLGKILGFTFRENFDYPYTATSITDFWRRWHISLSSWFREYLYIPLGGNRCSKPRMYFNLFVVWLSTGFWHGASWNFVLWGLYYFVILVLEKLFFGKLLAKLPKFLSRTYSFILVMFGWVLFAFTDMGAGLAFFGDLFGQTSAFATPDTVFHLVRSILFLVIMAVGATPYPTKIFWRIWEKHTAFRYAVAALLPAALILCTAYLVDNSYNPFIYFIF